ncbi:DUF397 domain-containing protein [Streptomyces sp. G-G2]|uniref:DUF397 domain-containing protein n=1 Tax=Streptomyces sp. G-G2 TaxID=3046201 RepID=UPI0024BA3828|nr:DUF397 domain-containing protein [Streptomyces sp. G-G2]MDJ0383398.1 DUF397 domain-containing protein [Streptomyces sp. G-G2]
MTTETETLHWFTSSYSENGGACVSVATDLAASHGTVPVRDSKRPDGPVIAFSRNAFTGLLDLARGADV